MKIKYFLLAAISGAVICADQVTKLFIHTRFLLGENYTVIPDFFNITYVRNYGAAFGMMAQMAPSFREPFFAIIPVIALIVIITILRSTPDNDKWQIFALSLIFGGAIGNYIDRLRFKYVIDFLDIHYKEVYHWPAFNIADSAIVIGVSILIAQMIFGNQTEKSKKPATR